MLRFRYDAFTEEQCAEYLTRIGFVYDGAPTKENLDQILRCHLTSVPFENLAPRYGFGTVDLSRDALFEKIVRQHRGGFCFELNGALYYLLRGLGYDCYSSLVRICAKGSDQFRGLSHRGVIVRIGGKEHFADVGFGGAKLPMAVEVSDRLQECDGKFYRGADGENGWKLILMKEEGEEERPIFAYSPAALQDDEFGPFCDALLKSPESGFRRGLMVNICTETGGYRDLRNLTLTVSEGGKKDVREIREEELPEVLKEHFGIDFRMPRA